ncbi:hypothetical protein DITRI_Ditri02bG0008100 [Diplodiscus trichospermus]
MWRGSQLSLGRPLLAVFFRKPVFWNLDPLSKWIVWAKAKDGPFVLDSRVGLHNGSSRNSFSVSVQGKVKRQVKGKGNIMVFMEGRWLWLLMHWQRSVMTPRGKISVSQKPLGDLVLIIDQRNWEPNDRNNG